MIAIQIELTDIDHNNNKPHEHLSIFKFSLKYLFDH